MLIKALELADPETKEELWGWIERKEFDHEEKIKAVTRIYDRLGIKEVAFAAIDKYLKMSQDILDNAGELTLELALFYLYDCFCHHVSGYLLCQIPESRIKGR